MDRGSRGINFMLGALVFNVAPTMFEVAIVAAILTAKCGPGMGALTVATLAGALAEVCTHRGTLALPCWQSALTAAVHKHLVVALALQPR